MDTIQIISPGNQQTQPIDTNDEVLDDDMEDGIFNLGNDIDGVLEAIGMRGNPWVLLQNSILAFIVISCCLGVAVCIPYLVGRLMIMVKKKKSDDFPAFTKKKCNFIFYDLDSPTPFYRKNDRCFTIRHGSYGGLRPRSLVSLGAPLAGNQWTDYFPCFQWGLMGGWVVVLFVVVSFGSDWDLDGPSLQKQSLDGQQCSIALLVNSIPIAQRFSPPWTYQTHLL
jgi:hypothetical protein